jgi:hypothetical protein
MKKTDALDYTFHLEIFVNDDDSIIYIYKNKRLGFSKSNNDFIKVDEFYYDI